MTQTALLKQPPGGHTRPAPPPGRAQTSDSDMSGSATTVFKTAVESAQAMQARSDVDS